jgi:DNA-binding transcriptional regulator YiaG
MSDLGDFIEYVNKEVAKYEKSLKEDDSKNLKKIVSVRVKMYRLKHKLTRDQLAEKLCVSRMQVFRWEEGLNAPRGMAQKILRDAGIIN